MKLLKTGGQLLFALLMVTAGHTQVEPGREVRIADNTADLGWSAEALDDVAEHAQSLGTAAMIVITRDQMIMEYGDTSYPYRAHSIRKSFLSALIGIAVDREQIDSTRTLAGLSIDDNQPLTAIEKTATIHQLMQARSGVYHPATSETKAMKAGRPERGSHLPGEVWYYNNWGFNALGTIYSDLTGEKVGDAFYEEIAERIGMEDFKLADIWYQSESDVSQYASYKFRISARDLARFGLLYLHNGAWNNEQVLPADWVAESTRNYSQTDQSGTKSGYGLMWWVTADGDHGLPAGSYTASGSGGQRLTVLPSIETIVVHLADTDRQIRPKIGTSIYNGLIRRILAARIP